MMEHPHAHPHHNNFLIDGHHQNNTTELPSVNFIMKFDDDNDENDGGGGIDENNFPSCSASSASFLNNHPNHHHNNHQFYYDSLMNQNVDNSVIIPQLNPTCPSSASASASSLTSNDWIIKMDSNQAKNLFEKSSLDKSLDNDDGSMMTMMMSSTPKLNNPNCTTSMNNTNHKKRKSKTSNSSTTKSNYKHIPHKDKPIHLVARRNARERKRVQAVNMAFMRLRKCVPVENRNKRLSKVKTLHRAIEYIAALDRLLKYSNPSSNMAEDAQVSTPATIINEQDSSIFSNSSLSTSSSSMSSDLFSCDNLMMDINQSNNGNVEWLTNTNTNTATITTNTTIASTATSTTTTIRRRRISNNHLDGLRNPAQFHHYHRPSEELNRQSTNPIVITNHNKENYIFNK